MPENCTLWAAADIYQIHFKSALSSDFNYVSWIHCTSHFGFILNSPRSNNSRL